MSIYRIKMNDKVYEMEVELIEEGTHKDTTPSSKSKDKTDDLPKAKAIEQISANTITSPMPGSIVELVAGQGDKVNEGDVVLILEAMKMENEICAPKSGTIKTVYVKEGQAVSSGTPLFEMED